MRVTDMEYLIVRVTEENYPLFDEMVRRRTGRSEEASSVTPDIVRELSSPDLYLYAASVADSFVGWISLVYIPKVGIWKGKGHIYVDELWVDPSYRGKGIAKALLSQADELKSSLDAHGIRLYVSVDNPAARSLYAQCGFISSGETVFMEK
ncbi:Acetyltransferase (GNAT) family protein [Oscillospiraceae bacterium]|nr:Acetyltransferase (GNAT) family protein [Oscillospiraceae bacterium]